MEPISIKVFSNQIVVELQKKDKVSGSLSKKTLYTIASIFAGWKTHVLPDIYFAFSMPQKKIMLRADHLFTALAHRNIFYWRAMTHKIRVKHSVDIDEVKVLHDGIRESYKKILPRTHRDYQAICLSFTLSCV